MDVILIITGGRDFNNYPLLIGSIEYIKRDRGIDIVEIVEGACHVGVLTFTRKDGTRVFGADGLAEKYASQWNVPLKPMPADWGKYGRPAGPIRNKEMADYAVGFAETPICLSFWDKKSKGTKDMMRTASEYGIEVIEVNY